MKIEIHLFASLTQYMDHDVIEQGNMLEIDDGSKVRELLQKLKVPLESVKLVFINGIHGEIDASLQEGDRVGVFPPVGGG